MATIFAFYSNWKCWAFLHPRKTKKRCGKYIYRWFWRKSRLFFEQRIIFYMFHAGKHARFFKTNDNPNPHIWTHFSWLYQCLKSNVYDIIGGVCKDHWDTSSGKFTCQPHSLWQCLSQGIVKYVSRCCRCFNSVSKMLSLF